MIILGQLRSIICQQAMMLLKCLTHDNLPSKAMLSANALIYSFDQRAEHDAYWLAQCRGYTDILFNLLDVMLFSVL